MGGCKYLYFVCALRTLRVPLVTVIPFGGKVIVLAGDFRQVLPVEKRGSHAQIMATILKHSHLWKYIQQRKLTEYICVLRNGSDEENGCYTWSR